MKKLLNPHLAGDWKSHIDVIKRWQPKIALVLSPTFDDVKLLKDTVPGIQVIGRFYHDDNWYASNISKDPTHFANQIHEEIISNPVHTILDYVQTNNETNQDWEGIQKLNQFSFAWMYLADRDKAYKCAIMSFSVGNPDLPNKPNDPAGFDGKMLYWQQILPSLLYAQEHDHVLNLHAYGYKSIFEPDENWYIHRYERQIVKNLNELGITKLKYLYGEIGIDGLIASNKSGYVSTTSPQDYVNQLIKYESVGQNFNNFLGACIFTVGDSGGWNDYNLLSTNAAELLVQHYENTTDYNGDIPTNMNNTVYVPNVQNTNPTVDKIDWDENLTKRGVVLKPYTPKDGETYWKVIKGEYSEDGQKEHIFVNTLDENGSQETDVEVDFYWADGDVPKETKDISKDPYAFGMADLDLHATGNSYGCRIKNLPSDDVWGCGLGSIAKPNWNMHVWYRFTFQKVTYNTMKTDPIPQTPTPTSNSGDSSPVTVSFRGKVLATVLNVRSGPDLNSNVVGQLGNGAVVDVIDHVNGWYKIGDNQFVADSFVEHYSDDKEVVDAIVTSIAHMYHIDPLVTKAVFAIESGGSAYGPDGKPIIRFENKVFFDRLKNPDLYYKYFNSGSNPSDDVWRENENSEFIHFHGNQTLEWKVFEFAKTLNQDDAENSISIGICQIMGFNADDVGYPTAAHMINAFSQKNLSGIVAQTVAFFAFCLSRGLIQVMLNKDFLSFAKVYNGADSYAVLLSNEYKLLGGS